MPTRLPHRRQFLASSAGLAGNLCRAARPIRPNIVLIVADDLGYETLGSSGGASYQTPHLDRLAATGVRFTHAYAQPLCTPTRVQLMTGKYNFRNWRAFGILDPAEKTFGHMLREAGYRTCIAGKWQLYSYNPPDYEPEWRGKGMRAEQAGFDEFCLWHAHHTEEKGSRYADPTIYQNGRYRDDTRGKYGPDLFAEFLIGFLERNASRPFFAYYPMALTHAPFNPTPLSPEWKTGDRLQAHPRFFADMVRYMDLLIGRIVKALDERGLRERTLILFTSDNGSPREITSRMGDRWIRGGKGLTTDAGTRVPLIANWKGTAPEGMVCDDLVDSTDFVPTLLEAAGAGPPAGVKLDGRSFLPQVCGARGDPREWVFFHHDPRPGWDKSQYRLERWARDRRFKLYEDGRFYDVGRDPDEAQPLSADALTPEARHARERLAAVLAMLRPEPR